MRHTFARTIWTMFTNIIRAPLSVLEYAKHNNMNRNKLSRKHLKIYDLAEYGIWFNLSDKHLTASLKPHNSKDVIPLYSSLMG